MPAILALAAIAYSVALTPRPRIALHDPLIRLSTVAGFEHLPAPLRLDAANIVVARMPAAENRLSLSRAALRRLIERRLPGLHVVPGRTDTSIEFTVTAARTIDRPGEGCRSLVAARTEGQPITLADTRPSACPDTPAAPVRYDRETAVVLAGNDLGAGAYLGRVSFQPGNVVNRGDALRLVSRVGVVTIERSVTAMQASRGRGAIFVRDADGQVLVARVATTGLAR